MKPFAALLLAFVVVQSLETYIFLGHDQLGYSRGIEAVDKDYIMRHYDLYSGPKPPPIDHLGINDIFFEKASVVWYFYQGQWLQLRGTD